MAIVSLSTKSSNQQLKDEVIKILKEKKVVKESKK